MGPIGAARVGFVDGEYVLNPRQDKALEDGRLDLVVAATQDAVMMVESEAKELTEEEIDQSIRILTEIYNDHPDMMGG